MIKIIYEDNQLLVCEKPFNIPVQEDVSKDEDLLSILKRYVKEKYNKPGNVFLGLVHRLDRPVGGVMVFARTSKAASRLSNEIRERSFGKKYLAVVQGTPEKSSDIFQDYLYKDSKKNIVSVVDEGIKGAKKAVLSYELIETKNNLSLVKIDLLTGRPHQIRVQFSSRGMPLFGDVKYGGDSFKNICLWSYGISFKHPVKEEIMNFNLLPPDELPWKNFNTDNL